ncbi:MAG TPA: bifunctional (p)ppGpp synthetase/guanosine-3',5'-bis(diphosphate) 3'-pyrophosphohydrolase [Pyrinomonadaceae bacterium]|jgi:GTP pyrophosphokinase|nr:bifunctional (p)ppGpp synthetase/guanosine-3',5'-bis(diphosphate) 3'-pyrophosphohydrolase [Pyrinomonadaceae bacterium]
MIRIEEIVNKVGRNHPQADLDMLRRAYFFSALHHKGQTRASGEPYLVHPLEVANILADMRLDEVSVATGLLHDVVEDTLVELDVIRESFGEEIAHLVHGLTKIAQISNQSHEEQQAENVRKMLLAMVDDVRVVLVKLADRLHNMRTLQHLRPEKRRRIAQETLDIFAPIAHRLGMGRLRGELEDLAFRHLHPEEYTELSAQLERRRPEHEAFLGDVTARVEEKMRESGVPFIRVEGRVKRLYSIFKKLRRQKIELDQVYDLIAARIVTPDEVRYCYAALGVVHNLWQPIPGRFKDWIATPRDNLYRSLHTSVFGSKGQPFEVQIRTEEMHRIAEEGVAAHWKYKEGRRGAHDDDEAFQWLRSLVEWSQEVKDSRDFLESLKLDLYPKDVYAFTPKGKVVQLPRGATPVDFAFMIHTEVGNTCSGARINGRMVPLRTPIQNGDVVEILTSPNMKPSRDWLNFVKTSRARNRVRHAVAEQQRAESIELGRKLFEKEAVRFNLSPKKLLGDADGGLKRIANEYGYGRVDDLLAAVGYGKIVPRNVIAKYLGPEKFAELEQRKESPLRSRVTAGVQAVKKFIRLGEDSIVVRGVDDLLVTRARCCNPVRGEEIVGYITRGKGVTVHARRCTNVQSLMVNRERVVEVEWAGETDAAAAYAVRLLAITENRTGMIADVTNAIKDIKTNIRSSNASVSQDDRGRIEVTVEVFDLKHLDKVMTSIRKVPGVLDVERVHGAA